MARRVRPLLAHVGSLLDPKPPVRSLFERDRTAERAEAESAAQAPARSDPRTVTD
ncbi:hypothetical protein SPDO_22200 [Sphingomonas dokdonensis]|uniref:Uncharacterized protein n=1 Tax=Sphingomonas dokdonensis TaxID=344880 RepID=A0A245ZHL7_9SPHN|nr:hypothetical protein SPDO_22200 [Sphingomonas dokdonensis]